MRLARLFALTLFVFVACAQQAQLANTLPDTPAAQQFAAWLKLFNGTDREAYGAFLEKNIPWRAAHLDQEWDFRQRTGGFELKKVEASSPTTLVVLLKERGSDQFARLTVQEDAAEPHAIIRFELRAIPTPADFPQPHLSESELITALQKKLEKDSADGSFAGAALVAKDGKPVFAEAYGLADREHKLPNTLNTRFRIGSMNKMFTATAILQLAQAGKLGLNDPLGKYLTDYPNKDVTSQVTIHHLLTHTGGTGDIFGPEFDAHRQELRTLQDYVKLYGNRGLGFAPSSGRWEYSNYGFILLGVVIEKVSGESYYDYVREHIYEPAGMTSTGSEPENQPVTDRSVGYTAMGGGSVHPNTDTLPWRGTSAGGGYTTVGDLLRFANALQQNKLLDAHYTELLTAGKVPGSTGSYAYGFEDRTINGTRCFGHGGGAPGMNGDLKICPGPGYVVAVLSNMDPPAATRISDFITDRLPGK
jgi:D-alanyl-D-alanine carboxypeptidase